MELKRQIQRDLKFERKKFKTQFEMQIHFAF